MNNLEKIRKAYAMGWSATLETFSVEKRGQRVIADVIDIKDKMVLIRIQNDSSLWSCERMFEERANEIIGFKFMGQLGGNEPIEEGQKFRVKEGEVGAIGTFIEWNERVKLIVLKKDNCNPIVTQKECIEPIFD